MVAKQLKKVIEKHRRKKFLKLETRMEVERTVFFVADLLKEAGYKDAACFTEALGNEIDEMGTEEILSEHIFDWKE